MMPSSQHDHHHGSSSTLPAMLSMSASSTAESGVPNKRIDQRKYRQSSLVGFDPLLGNGSTSEMSTKEYMKDKSRMVKKPSSLSVPSSPSSSLHTIENQSFRLKELRKIVKQLGSPKKQNQQTVNIDSSYAIPTTGTNVTSNPLKARPKNLKCDSRVQSDDTHRHSLKDMPQRIVNIDNIFTSPSSNKSTMKSPASTKADGGRRRKLPWTRHHRRSASLPEAPKVEDADNRNENIEGATIWPIGVDARAGAGVASITQQNPFDTQQNPFDVLIGIGSAKSMLHPNNKPPKSPNCLSLPASPMMQDFSQLSMSSSQRMMNSGARAKLIVPALAKPSPTSFLTGTEVMRTSETDASPFQLDIPPLHEFIVNSRICQFLDTYRKEDLNIDLNESLVGVPRLQLQTFITHGILPPSSGHLVDIHKSIVESLLEITDDIELAGFFQETNANGGSTVDHRREVAVLERQRQFIIVFRGTTSQQSGKVMKSKKLHSLETIHSDSKESSSSSIKVFALIKDNYIDLEARVFQCVDSLTEQNPFCDVVFTGHSFGGAIATLAAYRYATIRPTARVSCYVFGSPKVGNREFRQSANSLPNLKIMRTEYGNDPKCYIPADGVHVGHAIVVNGASSSKDCVMAYKFDDNEHPIKHHTRPKFGARKKERNIEAYVSTLEEIQTSNKPWVEDYVGEDVGDGVLGKDNEERQMV